MPLLPCNIWGFRGFTIQHFVSVAFAFRINRTKTDAMSYKIVCECHNMVRVCSVDFRDSTLFRKRHSPWTTHAKSECVRRKDFSYEFVKKLAVRHFFPDVPAEPIRLRWLPSNKTEMPKYSWFVRGVKHWDVSCLNIIICYLLAERARTYPVCDASDSMRKPLRCANRKRLEWNEAFRDTRFPH